MSAADIDELLRDDAKLRSVASEMFEELDSDQSGKMDKMEFRRNFMGKYIPNELTSAEIESLFSAIDSDGSGEVDLEEFTELVRRVFMAMKQYV